MIRYSLFLIVFLLFAFVNPTFAYKINNNMQANNDSISDSTRTVNRFYFAGGFNLISFDPTVNNGLIPSFYSSEILLKKRGLDYGLKFSPNYHFISPKHSIPGNVVSNEFYISLNAYIDIYKKEDFSLYFYSGGSLYWDRAIEYENSSKKTVKVHSRHIIFGPNIGFGASYFISDRTFFRLNLSAGLGYSSIFTKFKNGRIIQDNNGVGFFTPDLLEFSVGILLFEKM